MTGVSDALKTLREAGLFGGIPEAPKPDASPKMAQPKAGAAAPDPKFASVTRMRDLLALGPVAHSEFKNKYPERYETLR